MYQKSPSSLIKHIDFMILDLVSFLLSLWIAYYFYLHSWRIWEAQTYKSLLLLLALVHICVSAFDNNYKDILRRGYFKELIATFRHVAIVIAITLFLSFFSKTSVILSRAVMIYTIVFSLALIWITRTIWKKFIHYHLSLDPRLLLLVSDPSGAERILRQFHDQMLDFKVTGIVLIETDNTVAGREAGAFDEAAAGNGATAVNKAAAFDEAAVGNGGTADNKAAADKETTVGSGATAGNGAAANKETTVGSGAAAGNEAAAFDEAAATSERAADTETGGRTIEGIPVVADTNNLIDYLLKNAIDEILFSIPQGTRLPYDMIRQCSLMGITIHLEMMSTDELAGARYQEDIAGLTVMTSYLKLITTGQAFLKRLLDIFGSIIGLLFTAIIFLFVAPAIYISDPGPIFFRQKRVGKNGRIFNFYKFRSMYQDAEERKAGLMAQNEIKGQMFKMENDPRIIGSGPDGTRHGIGHFIRSTSLDEFPQFWNVLKGDMSLVGI